MKFRPHPPSSIGLPSSLLWGSGFSFTLLSMNLTFIVVKIVPFFLSFHYIIGTSCNIITPTIEHNIYRSETNETCIRSHRLERWMTVCVCCRQVGGKCKLSTNASQRRCQTSDGLICSGRGECVCGACICQVTEPGVYYGPRCECHDWVCAAYDGKTCGGKYYYRLFQMTNIQLPFSLHWPVAHITIQYEMRKRMWPKLLKAFIQSWWKLLMFHLSLVTGTLFQFHWVYFHSNTNLFKILSLTFFQHQRYCINNSEHCFQKALLLPVLILCVTIE